MANDREPISRERLHAQRCHDQNMERMVDELRQLLGDDRDFFQALHRLLQMDNTDGVRLIPRMPGPERKALLKWILPLARLGIAEATFKMEDKYR